MTKPENYGTGSCSCIECVVDSEPEPLEGANAMTKSVLRQTIEAVLQPYTIDDGTRYQFDSLANDLEKAIAEKVMSHDIDYCSVEASLRPELSGNP